MSKFSIIVPILNSNTVNKLVNSIKSQTWNDWEVFFIDGGSRKKNINYLKELSIKDKRISFLRQSKSKKGIFGAMNQGLDMIDKNSWILFLGSDDKLKDNFVLEKINNKINELEPNKIDLLICRGIYFDPQKSIYRREAYFIPKHGDSFLNLDDYKKLIIRGYTPPHQTTLFNGNSRVLKNQYNDDYDISGDLELFCRITKFYKLSVLNSSLNIVTMSTGGISDTKHLLKLKEVIGCYLKYYKFRFIYTLIRRYLNKFRSVL